MFIVFGGLFSPHNGYDLFSSTVMAHPQRSAEGSMVLHKKMLPLRSTFPDKPFPNGKRIERARY
jgi:hypothetical protein